MNDMSQTIVPKSDQLNADDLIAGPRTIKIREVKISPGTEQPVAVFFNGDDGKPYLPCKSMRRVMVALWGPDANVYVDRAMTLYRDPTVTWGGMEVGGIRISHMSHIAEPTMVVLTATKKTRKPFRVLPLAEAKPAASSVATTSPEQAARAFTDQMLTDIAAAADIDTLHDLAGNAVLQRRRDRLKVAFPAMDEEIAQAFSGKFQSFPQVAK